jgi:hypothetical protein
MAIQGHPLPQPINVQDRNHFAGVPNPGQQEALVCHEGLPDLWGIARRGVE